MPATSALDPIVAAIKAGRLADAERLCQRSLAGSPDDTDALLLWGLSLLRQDKDAEAVPVYRRLTELHPDESMHWGNYATALRRAGDVAAAEAAAARMVDLAPEEPGALEQLGLLHLQCGKPLQAREVLLRASAKSPDSPSLRMHAAGALTACRDSRAEEWLRPWREWTGLSDDEYLELAELLIRVREVRDAQELLEEMVRRVPNAWAAQLLLAKTCERVNQLDRAEAILRGIVAGGGAGHPYVRGEIARQNAQLAMRRHAYGAARVLLEQTGPTDEADCGHYFTLAKACDRLGDAEAALRALEIAHARQVAEVRLIDAELFAADAPPLPRVDQRLREADYRAWPTLRGPDVGQSPVFVVGFPRSGTTLLEQMLDAHPALQSMDERPFFNELAGQLGDIGIRVPEDLGKLDQRDCDELRKGYLILACGKVARQWDTRLVDKNPLHMLWLPMIHRLFPDAKVILALRHPCDVILSCYMQSFQAPSLAAAGRSLTQLAKAYTAAMENWLYHAALLKPDVLVSRYEDLVADTPAQTRRIAHFLGFDDAEPMLHFDARAREKGFIATPSYTQVIEPINTRGVGHWTQYRAYFEPLLPILQPMLEHWGYVEAPAVRATAG